jgi:hypothetical protein
MGRPNEYARLAVAIVENPMLSGSCIRLDGGQRSAPKRILPAAVRRRPVGRTRPRRGRVGQRGHCRPGARCARLPAAPEILINKRYTNCHRHRRVGTAILMTSSATGHPPTRYWSSCLGGLAHCRFNEEVVLWHSSFARTKTGWPC